MAESAILLDIEGTTTPIDFVFDILFPYARDHMRAFVLEHWAAEETHRDVASLIEENQKDRRCGLAPPPLPGRPEEADPDDVVAYLFWLMDLNRKSTPLKSLQGRIWEAGYYAGHLKAQVFDDVPPALARWRSQAKRVAIFSSGSVLAQKLLFSHTEVGDLTDLIDDYFDTNIGMKVEPGSYQQIAGRLGVAPSAVLFISDVTAELEAARETGVEVLLCVRPGNRPQPNSAVYPAVASFDEIFP